MITTISFNIIPLDCQPNHVCVCVYIIDINLLFVNNNMEQYANASPNERIHIIDRDSKTTLYELDEDAFTSFNVLYIYIYHTQTII